MQQKQQFAKQIQSARHRLGLSQSQAAAEWRVKLKTLQHWEQGRGLPRGATLLRLLPLLSAPRRKSS